MSRPARGAWIEIELQDGKSRLRGSRPARGAWIEISGLDRAVIVAPSVAPRKGRVD